MGNLESERNNNFNSLKRIIERAQLGTYVGIYEEGRKDEKGIKLEDDVIEINVRFDGEVYQALYRVSTSTKRRKEIRKLIEQGSVRKGHVNRMKYKNKAIIEI